MGISTLIHNLAAKDPKPSTLAVGSAELSEKDVLRLRHLNGVNLGALFVQEKWIDNSLFNENAPGVGGSELAALTSWGAKADLTDLQKKWENHWQTFVTEDDFRLMRERGVNAIRLPIGFWNLGDEKLLRHTPFEKFAKVYEHSWEHVQRVIAMATSQQMTVVVDFHGLPGGANKDEHSGTTSGKAELWDHRRFREAAISAYREAVQRIGADDNAVKHLILLQLANEVPYGEPKAPAFYLDAASTIRNVDSAIPLVISDGWNLGQTIERVQQWNEKLERGGNICDTGFIVDTHIYRTFSEEDRARSADEHIKRAASSVEPSDDVDIIVGEWSCTLDEQSWSKSPDGDRGAREVEYGLSQLTAFSKLAGNFFWTYKFGQGNGGSWDWRTMSERGVVLPRLAQNRGDMKAALSVALSNHTKYWESVDSKQDWENWRFQSGFERGWDDADRFAEFDGSRPGQVAHLKVVRTAQHAKSKGSSDKLWVFSQGYIQGIRARVAAE